MVLINVQSCTIYIVLVNAASSFGSIDAYRLCQSFSQMSPIADLVTSYKGAWMPETRNMRRRVDSSEPTLQCDDRMRRMVDELSSVPA